MIDLDKYNRLLQASYRLFCIQVGAGKWTEKQMTERNRELCAKKYGEIGNEITAYEEYRRER